MAAKSTYSKLATEDTKQETKTDNWGNYEEDHETSESEHSSVFSYNPEWKSLIDPQGNLFFLKAQACLYPGRFAIKISLNWNLD